MALYDDEDKSELAEGIGKPDELLPELRQARDAAVKLFEDAGIQRGGRNLQAYVTACVRQLRDQRFRAQFLVAIKKFVSLFDTLMPRPEARPFGEEVKIYVFVGKVAANLYRDASLDVRGLANKVPTMPLAYIEAHGVDPENSGRRNPGPELRCRGGASGWRPRESGRDGERSPSPHLDFLR